MENACTHFINHPGKGRRWLPIINCRLFILSWRYKLEFRHTDYIRGVCHAELQRDVWNILRIQRGEQRRGMKKRKGGWGEIFLSTLWRNTFLVLEPIIFTKISAYILCVCVCNFFGIYNISCITGLGHFYLYLIGQTCVYMYVYVWEEGSGHTLPPRGHRAHIGINSSTGF